MVTMSDVARVAGVSQSTVSHVINNTRAIAPQTRSAVLAAIEATGYVHDEVARAMRSRRTGTIGVATSAISNIYFSEVVSAIERTATPLRRIVMLIDTHDEPVRELEAIRTFVGRRVDGVVLAPSADPSASLALLRHRQVPTVLLDRHVEVQDWPCDVVGVANTEPTARLVDLLVEAGHTHIGYVAGRPGLSTSEERLAGFHAGLARHPGARGRVVTGMSDESGAEKATVELLSAAQRPSAVIPANNAMTVGVLRGATALGLRVPQDLSLACFDDLPWADALSPRLTVAAQPLAELGGLAMRMLHERIEQPDLPGRDVRLEPTILVRDSIGPPSGH